MQQQFPTQFSRNPWSTSAAALRGPGAFAYILLSRLVSWSVLVMTGKRYYSWAPFGSQRFITWEKLKMVTDHF
eukprot:scaffold14125_cov146-Skeletonema_menzelii.AAC.2